MYSWTQLPWLRFFRAFSSVVKQMPGYNYPRRGTARTLPKLLCCSMYRLFCVVLCIVCVKMCTVLLPPGDNTIAVNKYIISYVHFKSTAGSCRPQIATNVRLGRRAFAEVKALTIGNNCSFQRGETCEAKMLFSWPIITKIPTLIISRCYCSTLTVLTQISHHIRWLVVCCDLT
jgi:hypothetical protein